jgi:hypothetical protein
MNLYGPIGIMCCLCIHSYLYRFLKTLLVISLSLCFFIIRLGLFSMRLVFYDVPMWTLWAGGPVGWAERVHLAGRRIRRPG